MRHRYNRFLKLSTGVQKKDNVIRNMITSLLKEKRIITTPKKARVLAWEVERLFAKLVRTYNRFDNKEDSIREVKKILLSSLFDEKLIPSIIDEKLIPYIEGNRKSGFIRKYRVGIRKWDSVEKFMVELV